MSIPIFSCLFYLHFHQVCDPQTLPPDLASFFSLPSESVACWEPGGGHLSPRAFVAAQLSLARRAGARLIPSLATGLTKRGDNWEVITETGESVTGRKVVLAQGTYTAINSLLASLLPPFDLTLTAQTTALLEVISYNVDLGCFTIPRLTRRRLTGYQQCQAWSSRSTHPFNRYPQYLFTSINMSAAVGAIPIHLHPAANPLPKWTTLPQVWSSRSVQRIENKGKLGLLPGRTL